MKLKTLVTTAITTVLGAAIILPAQATNGTITFNGSVASTTCSIDVNGSGAATATVILPPAQLPRLNGNGNTTGDTNFNFQLTGCSNAAHNPGVAVHFEPGNTVNENGRLSNTSSSGNSTGVDLAIFEQGSASALTLGQAPQTGYVNIASNSATLAYTVKYHSTSASPTPGALRSSVTYSIVYF